MSTVIDTQVVEMKFDARDFDNNVQHTMGLLDRFKEQLNFTGATKGIEDISKASDKVRLTHLEEAAIAVEMKFNAMSIATITAISNIVNKAMTAGEQIVKSLTIDQVTAGFGKYESKLSSVQTIMNATGLSIEEVNEQLDKLIWFTDETSYSFTDMVANVGKFTSNQVDLGVATKAMMGIANAAGLAGSSVENASHAMTGFSKAIAKGYMDRQNWTWIQTARMDTYQFKEIILEAAESLGTLTKVGDGAYQTMKGTAVTATDFLEAMSEGWFTSDVMLKSLGVFGDYADQIYQICAETGMLASEAMDAFGDNVNLVGEKAFRASQEAKTFTDAINATKDAVSSGWMETFERLFGNYEEAKVLWTELANELYDIFAEGGNRRNAMLDEWVELGGRATLIYTVKEAYRSLLSIVMPLKEALDEMFPAMTGRKLLQLTLNVTKFVKSLRLSEEAAYSLKVIFKTLLLPIEAVFTAIKIGVTVITSLITIVFKLTNAFLELIAETNPLEDLFRKLFGDERYTRLMTAMATIGSNLASVFSWIGQQILSIIASIGKSNRVMSFLQSLYKLLSPIGNLILDAIVFGFELLASLDFKNLTLLGGAILEAIGNKLGWVGNILGGVYALILSIGKTITSYFGFATLFGQEIDAVDTLRYSFTSLNATISNFKTSFTLDGMFSGLSHLTEGLTNVIGGLAGSFGELVQRMSPAKILIMAFGAALTGLMISLTSMASSFAATSVAVTNLVTQTATAIKNYGRPSRIMQIAKALVVLAGAVLLLSLVNPQNLGAAVLAMAELAIVLGALYAAFALIDKYLISNEKTISALTASVFKISAALFLLAGGLTLLNGIDTTGLGQRVGALITIMTSLGIVVTLMSRFMKKDITKMSGLLIAFALSLSAMVGALKKLVNFNGNALLGAMGSLIALMGLLAIMSRTMGQIKFSGSIGVTAMIGNIFLIVLALEALNGIPLNTIVQSLNRFGLIVAMLAALMLSTKFAGENAAKAGIYVVAISGAMYILAEAVKVIGSLDTKIAKQGAAIVAGLLIIFAGITAATHLVGKETDKIAKALVMMSICIMLLSVCISYLGALDEDQAWQGFKVVSLMLAVMAVIMKLNSSVVGKDQKFKSGAAAMMAMAALLGVTAVALTLLTLLPDQDRLLTSAASLSLVMIAMGGAIKLMEKMQLTKALSTAAGLLLIIVPLAIAFTALNALEINDGLIQKAAALAILLGALAVAMRIVPSFAEFNAGKAFLGLISLAGITALLSQVFHLMKGIDPVNAIADAFALTILLEALASSVLVLSKFNTTGAKKMELARNALIELTICSGVLLTLLNLLRGMTWDEALGYAASLSLILLALSVSVDILSNFKSTSEKKMAAAAIGMIALGGVATAVVALLGILEACDLKAGLGNVAAFIAVALALSGVAVVLSLIKEANLGAAMQAIVAAGAAMLVAIGVIGVAVLAFGGLIQLIEKWDWKGSQAAIEVFGTIGAMFGEAIGQFIGHIGSGITSQLEQMGADFEAFMTHMRNIDKQALDGAVYLAESLITLTAANFITGLVGLGSISTGLYELGDALVSFSDGISGIDQNRVLTAAIAVKNLGEAYSYLHTGLLEDAGKFIFGDATFTNLANDLAGLGPALVKFSNSTEGINISSVQKGIDAAKMLVELESALNKHGGGITFFTGDADLSAFADNVADFGAGLLAFSDAITGKNRRTRKDGRSVGSTSGGIDVEAMKDATKAGQELAKLESSLRSTGGHFQTVFGDADLGSFGNNLADYGAGLLAYSDAITGKNSKSRKGGGGGGGIDVQAIQDSIPAGEALSKLEQGLSSTNGTWQSIFGGKENLGDFATNIGEFGNGLLMYYNNIKDINFDKLSESAGVGFIFSSLESSLGEKGGFFEYFTGGAKDFTDFSTSLKSLGIALKNYDYQIKDMDIVRVSAANEGLKGLLDIADAANAVSMNGMLSLSNAIAQLAATSLDNFVSTFINSKDRIVSSIKETLALVAADLTAGDSLIALGGVMTKGIIDGVIQNESGMTREGQNFVGFFSMGIHSKELDLKSDGIYIINTIIAGVEARQNELKTRINKVILTTLDSQLNNIKIYTTSKDIGMNVMEGIIEGVKVKKKALENTMTDVSQMMIDTAMDVLDEHSPSVEFRTIGKNAIQGEIEGIEDATPDLNKTMKVSSQGVIDEAIEDFKISGGKSETMRDKVGIYLIKGIAEGIYTDMSAEEAASQKAQNIVSAFQGAIDAASRDAEMSSTIFSIWENLYGANATDEEYLEAQKTDYQRRMKAAADTYMAKVGIWQTEVDSFGEDSKEAQDAMQNMLKSYNDFLSLSNEYLSLINETSEEATEDGLTAAQAFQQKAAAYNQWLAEWRQTFLDQGWSEDEVKEMARGATGFDPNALTSTGGQAGDKTTIQDLINEYIGDVQIEIDAAGAVIQERTEDSLSAGISSATRSATGSGLISGFSGGVEDFETYLGGNDFNLSNILQQTLGGGMGIDEAIEGFMPKEGSIISLLENFTGGASVWFNNLAGSASDGMSNAVNVANGWIDGLLGKESEMEETVTRVSQNTQNKMNAAWEVNSPSKVTERLGKYIMDGLRIGIENNGDITIDISSVIEKIMREADETIRSYSAKYREAGIYLADALVDGLIDRVRNRQAEAINEVVRLATQMYQAACGELGIGAGMSVAVNTVNKSVGGGGGGGGTSAGNYFLTNAQKDAITQLEKLAASGKLTDEEFQSQKGDILGKAQIVLEPVIDTSTTEKQLAEIQATTSTYKASSISASLGAQVGAAIQNSSNGSSSGGTTYNFYQTNNSPTALSRIDIYRDTSNLLSAAKGVN